MIEVICSGFGGQGVLVAGMILADAGMEDDKQVSWYPSYGFEMRGGAANCDVKISDEEIPSPYCLEPDIVYTLNEAAIDTYESRLKPGGILLVNSTLVPEARTSRSDIRVIKVPATQIAAELGNTRGTNIVMLGALACANVLRRVTDGATVRALKAELPGVYPEVFGFTAYFAGFDWTATGAENAKTPDAVLTIGLGLLSSLLDACPAPLVKRFTLKLPKKLCDSCVPCDEKKERPSTGGAVKKLLRLKFPEAYKLCC